MDLWEAYRKKAVGDFAASAFTLSTGGRKHTSLRMVEGKANELEVNRAVFESYDETHRYVTVKDMTYDVLITIYDVNTMSTMAARITGRLEKDDWRGMFYRLKKVRSPNFELRIIGSQNNYLLPLAGLDLFYRNLHCRLMEVDLFGNSVRHVAFDTKTGMPYDMLPLNRLYRPGELTCTVSREDFGSRLGKLIFV